MKEAQLTIVSKRLGLTGGNINFNSETFFGLNPGDKVIRIGNGKENGTIRTDDFNYPVEYVGSILCEFSESEKMFAFKLPEKTAENEDIFLLYGTTGHEIFTEAFGCMRFYAPVFTKLQLKNK